MTRRVQFVSFQMRKRILVQIFQEKIKNEFNH